VGLVANLPPAGRQFSNLPPQIPSRKRQRQHQ
jgi:hypothetical protein